MAGNRIKLQTEIERVLKRVSEGVLEFEDIRSKVYSTSNSNQREKHELELKKSIKKLQRLRDQIKTWLTSNEIKDKRSLMDARKLIESQMEKYRMTERDSKNKKLTREGTVFRPEDKKKGEMRVWIQKCLDDLRSQSEHFESEILKAKQKKGKKKDDEVELGKYERAVERHFYHTKCLEILLRRLENDDVSVEDLEEIKDSVDYYVESNHEAEFLEDEGIYDRFDIDINAEDESSDDSDSELSSPRSISPTPSVTLPTVPSSSSSTETSSASLSPRKTPPMKPQQGPPSSQKLPPSQLPPSSSSSSTPTPSSSSSSSSTSTKGTSAPLPNSSLSVKGTDKKVTPSQPLSSSLPPPSSTNSQASLSKKGTPQNQMPDLSSLNISDSSLPPSSSSSSSSSTPSQSVAAVVRAPSSATTPTPQMSSGKTPQKGPMQTPTQVPPPSSTPPPSSSSSSSSSSVSTVPSSKSVTQTPPLGPTSSANSAQQIKKAPPLAPASSSSQGPQPGSGSSSQSRAQTQTMKNPTDSSQRLSSSSGVNPAQKSDQRSAASIAASSPSLNSSTGSTTPPLKSQNVTAPPQSKPMSSIANSEGNRKHSSSNPPPYAQPSQYSNVPSAQASFPSQKLPYGQPEGRKTPVHPSDKWANQMEGEYPTYLSLDEGRNVMIDSLKDMMTRSYQSIPDFMEPEKAEVSAVNAYPTPPYYPQETSGIFDDPSIYRKVDPDVLFFIFFYQQGTYQQYLAAKELKAQKWRYHPQHQTWFQKHESQKAPSDQEIGTYSYFDYETPPGWAVKKKEFRFDYKSFEGSENA